jgi:membrane-bound acyltransferase YfiQ involved in biofilm formation
VLPNAYSATPCFLLENSTLVGRRWPAGVIRANRKHCVVVVCFALFGSLISMSSIEYKNTRVGQFQESFQEAEMKDLTYSGI